MTLSRTCFLWLLLLCGQVCSAQRYDSGWLIGSEQMVRISFDGTSIDTSSFHQGSATVANLFASSDVSDSMGNILFYCNGAEIGNSMGQIMENGDTLIDSLLYIDYQGGFVETQTNIILPRSGNTFYVFYMSESDSLYSHSPIDEPDRMYYAVVDMDANGGLGKVISKKNLVYKGLFGQGRLTACRHANGRDWWLVHQGEANDEYFIYLVTPDSVFSPSIQHIGPSSFFADNPGAQATFSPDGSRFVTSTALSPLLIMDFDRCIGTFSNPDSIFIPLDSLYYNNILATGGPGAPGNCFSPDGRFVYMCNTIEIWQYDTWAANVSQSAIKIGQWDSSGPVNAFYGLRQLYLMPNGQIIVDNVLGGSRSFHTIDSPNVQGVGCHFNFQSLSTNTYNADVIANMINYRLGPLAGSGCDTLTGISGPKTPEGGYMRVYPNPATERTTISLSQYHKGVRLYIYDGMGREVYHDESMYLDETIDVRGFASGVYTVRVLSADGSMMGRFVRE